jgi:lipopolysaccharide transport system ATP-binding protein
MRSPSQSSPDRVALEARTIGKRYRLGEHRSLRQTVGHLTGRGDGTNQTLQALDRVSFSVRRGEAFGIVGGNGSGKSTLLQIISGISVPSNGSMTVRGRVLPLLAVGTGFHPELTGRENVTLFGTVLGVPRPVISERMDAIAAFAELERHLDTPNKRYSDGMQARLSFAVAMLFPADIYLFDEVLAVVDGEFQARCLVEIKRLSESGRTVVFVSHNLDQVRELCHRAMWMQDGHIHQIGSTETVIGAYERAAA